MMWILTKTERRSILLVCIVVSSWAGRILALAKGDVFLQVETCIIAASALVVAFIAGGSHEPREVAQNSGVSAEVDPTNWVAIQDDDVR